MESKEEILKAMGGIPEEVYDAIVVSFYEEARARVATIAKAIESNDFDTIARAAHGIKGSAANLRLISIQDTAKALEYAAKSSNQADISKWQEQLVRLMA